MHFEICSCGILSFLFIYHYRKAGCYTTLCFDSLSLETMLTQLRNHSATCQLLDECRWADGQQDASRGPEHTKHLKVRLVPPRSKRPTLNRDSTVDALNRCHMSRPRVRHTTCETRKQLLSFFLPLSKTLAIINWQDLYRQSRRPFSLTLASTMTARAGFEYLTPPARS